MDKSEIDELRGRVLCGAVLEQAGFAIDIKESTRNAVKHRRGDEIIIVIHGGQGWFDPKSDAKGDVFSLVTHLDGMPFAQALRRVAGLVGFVPSEPAWPRAERKRPPDLGIPERWVRCRAPWPGSATWRYLRRQRALPETVLRAAVRQDCLRVGPHGSMWAVHREAKGATTGWEERGPDWRGFATGGAKVLFRLGSADAGRLCVTEAAIDAMSLAALEGLRDDSLYLSTGGGWAPATEAAISTLAARPGTHLVAATDNNPQGEIYADRLGAIAGAAASGFERLRPRGSDWNEDLRALKKEREEGRQSGLPPARRPPQGCASPARSVALDPTDRRGGNGDGVKKG